MVNKTQFYKTKVALAVVLSLGLAACGDSDGDEGSTSTSTSVVDSTQNTVGNQNELTGTVQGVVVDSNGNPLAGVMVYLGSQETTTNAGGQYVFTDVAVTNVNGVNNEGDESDDDVTQTLVVTIGGTASYLGALVTVTPEAQVNNTGGQGDNQNGGNSDVTIQTFVDGFTAQAGTAILPMLNAGAYGYIRDCRTGQPLVDTADILSLDFVAVTALNDVTATIAGNGTQLTNAEDTHTIASDADGMFSLDMLAQNSTYTISAKKGWTITSGSTTAATLSEGSSEFLGTIEVCPVSFTPADVSKAPFIKSIDGQIGTTTVDLTGTTSVDSASATVAAQYAALNQGVVNDFVINFSEEMASTFNLAEARVKVIAPGSSTSVTVSDATVTLAVDGKSATVTFVTDLAEGTKVDVWFPHWTATDANDSLFLVDNNAIIYDTVGLAITGTEKAVYTHAYFCTFAKPTDVASLELGPQVFNADTTEDGNSTDLSDYSLAFQDNFEESAGTAITQLNDGDANSGARLVALAAARGETVTIDQDYAVVAFDATNAASVIWKKGTATLTVPTVGAYTIEGTGANTELHIHNTKHNDTFSATPVNGFGDIISSGTKTVTVVDAIAPTTVLQESYNITDATGPRTGQDVVSGTTGNAAFGNGGEISLAGTVGTSVGNPIIHIQPRHLAGQTNGSADRNDELDSLTSGMSARLSAAEVTALGATASATALSQSTIGGFDMPVYDATAIAGWSAIPATIGVAFNENVKLTATAPVFDGSTSLTGYAVLNNVTNNVDGQPSGVDLVTFETANLVALSLDAGADLAFVGAVSDTRDNVATANAQVFIQDTFPPMMTAAVWNGNTLALTFNEPVVIPTAGTSITVINPANTALSQPVTVTTTNSVVAGNTLTITLGALNALIAPMFQDGANTEFLYNDDANALNEENHALINWDNISDATGNEWAEFTPAARGMEVTPLTTDTRRWEVVAPRFLAVNAVGPFTYTVATSGYQDAQAPALPDGDDNGVVVYTITFTHPIQLALGNAFSNAIDLVDGIATPDPITNLTYSTANTPGTAVLNALFVMDLNGDTVVDANDTFNEGVAGPTITNGSLVISNNNTTLTLTISADPTAQTIDFGTSTFGFKTTVTSAINTLQTSAGNFNWQNNN